MPNNELKGISPCWHKAQIIANIIGAIAIPVVIAIFTIVYSNSLKKREIGVHYFELAVGILREEPKPKTQALRKWAVALLEKHSDVPLSEDAKRVLMEEKIAVSICIPDTGITASGEHPQPSAR